MFCTDKGADLIELLDKRTDTELLLQTQRGLVSRGEEASGALAPGAFRDVLAGGWFLMLPNGPEPCEHRGTLYGQHGEATFASWTVDVISDRADCVIVRFTTRLRRTPVAVERVVTLRGHSATLVMDEAIRNESSQSIEVLWGHHPTFGAPFIEPGCRIDLPGGDAGTAPTLPADAGLMPGQHGAWPHLRGTDGSVIDLSVVPAGPIHDFIRLDRLADGWFAVRNPKRRVGIAVRWDQQLFPMLGCWRLLNGGPDYPWYGRYFALALEPSSDLPSLTAAIAKGTAISLDGGGSRATRLEATLFNSIGKVQAVGWGGGIDQCSE